MGILLKIIPHLAGLVLLGLGILIGLSDQIDPVDHTIEETGQACIILLLASLACTSFSRRFGWKFFIKFRRPLGLWSFTAAVAHLLVFAIAYVELSISLFIEEVAEHPYILVGMISFAILVPLAITSTRGWQKSLKQAWKKIHRLVYLACFFALIHIALQLREEWLNIASFSMIFSILMLERFLAQRASQS